jgi:hypothetical protein
MDIHSSCDTTNIRRLDRFRDAQLHILRRSQTIAGACSSLHAGSLVRLRPFEAAGWDIPSCGFIYNYQQQGGVQNGHPIKIGKHRIPDH